jgi:hypothetical protein
MARRCIDDRPENRATRTRRGVAALALIAFGAVACGRSAGERTNVLVPHGEAELVVMDFATPITLDPLPAGWHHRTFWTRAPMQMSFAVKDGVPALRLATAGTASMLFHHVDVDLVDYPILSWRWYVEQPIDSPLDERTREGDDHPARLFLTFHTNDGEDRSMEVIWGNRLLHRGDYKYIGGFAHYVANGGNENVGRWHRETIDLRQIYRTVWPDAAPAHVYEIALFCDSDDTKTASISYFADLALSR